VKGRERRRSPNRAEKADQAESAAERRLPDLSASFGDRRRSLLSQVFENTVYTFAAILSMFLLGTSAAPHSITDAREPSANV